LREAVEDRDFDRIVSLIYTDVHEDDNGCWLWRKQKKAKGSKSYPTTSWGAALHRVVCEAKYGAPLGSQHAHHACGNSICVNPDHLVPATNAENVAEMMARSSYIARIEELEAALAEAVPHHPLLGMIPVSRAC
jgi:hypothetical protein